MEALGSAQHLEVTQGCPLLGPGLGLVQSWSPEKCLLARDSYPQTATRQALGVLSCERKPRELSAQRWENLRRE